jgi:hypothetical protein
VLVSLVDGFCSGTSGVSSVAIEGCFATNEWPLGGADGCFDEAGARGVWDAGWTIGIGG